MKKLTLLLASLLLCAAGMAQVKFAPMTFENARQKAQAEGKEMLVDVVNGQKPNPEVDKYFKSNKDLSAFINKNFIPVRIDVTAPENAGVMDKLYSLMMPCVVFFSNQGEQLGATNWFAVTSGKADLKAQAEEALAKAAVKRANTRKVDMRALSFKEALEAARNEGKLLFVDNSIPGCRPCKLMEVDVFTLDNVADFYNKNFVSIHLDATTDPDQVAKNNGVRGFPGYLFFDADGGLVYQSGGFMPAENFIAEGQKALDVYNDNKEINLRKITLDEAKALAKSENKLIFVDLSATWCGPCKKMKTTTFKVPAVARFYNKNFVTMFVECDIQKEIAEQMKNLYGYSAYPTLLFLNAEGELLHKFVGSMETEDALKEGQKAIDGKGFASFTKRYEAGERDPQFIKEYIGVLSDSYEKKAAADVATEYLKGFTVEELLDKGNFTILMENIQDMDAAPAQLFLNNYDKFSAAFEKEADRYRSQLWHTKAVSFVKRGEKPTFDKAGYDAFIKRLTASNLPQETKDQITSISQYFNAENMGDWKTYVQMATARMKKEGAKTPMFVIYNQGLRIERLCKDQALRTKYAQGIQSVIDAREKAGIEPQGADEKFITSLKEMIGKLKK